MERDGFQQAERVGRGLGRWLGGPPGFSLHVGLFLLGATFLTLLNLLRSPQELWFWRPLAWWGGLLLLHAGLTVGGVVRRAEAGAPAPHRDRPVRTEPRLAPALGTAVARAAAAASAVVAGGVVTVARARADRGGAVRRPPTAASPRFVPPPSGWMSEDDAAFASWARRTDAWEAVREEEPAPATLANGRRPRPDALHGGTARWDAAAPSGTGVPDLAHRTPAATGRFRPDGRDAAGAELPASNGHASSGWTLPADVEAMWARPAAPGETPPSAAGSGGGAWASPTSTARHPDAVARAGESVPDRAAGRLREPTGDDVILDGSVSVPVDPKDPSWTRLEAAAEAWLARRDARSTPTPLPAPPAPTGTEGASPASP